MKIKNLVTAALLAGGAIATCESAFGQTYSGPPSLANDLIFGFQNQAGGGTEDYAINLGPASGIIGKSTVVDLSSDFSLTDFNAVLNGSSSMQGGVVGASSAGNPSDVYATQLRVGGAGAPAVPGSSVTQGLTRAQDGTTYAGMGSLYAPAAGTGGLDTGKSWENLVDPNSNTGTFQSNTGLDPDSTVAPASVVYEDLWFTSSSTISGAKPFIYLGYFKLDLTGASPKLTFTSTNVPGSVLSAPKIASVSKSGSTVKVVSSNAVSSHSYQLQYTASLRAPVAWSNTGSAIVATGTSVTNTDTAATGGPRFYRVSAQ